MVEVEVIPSASADVIPPEAVCQGTDVEGRAVELEAVYVVAGNARAVGVEVPGAASSVESSDAQRPIAECTPDGPVVQSDLGDRIGRQARPLVIHSPRSRGLLSDRQAGISRAEAEELLIGCSAQHFTGSGAGGVTWLGELSLGECQKPGRIWISTNAGPGRSGR